MSGQYDNPQVHRWEQHSKRFKGDPTINYPRLPFGYYMGYPITIG